MAASPRKLSSAATGHKKTAEAQNKILVYVAAHDMITVAQAMELLSLGKSRASELLSSMVHSGLHTKQGTNRATCYTSKCH